MRCSEDLDCSGTISLEEWIEALVRIRTSSQQVKEAARARSTCAEARKRQHSRGMTIYDERKAELDAAMDAVRKHAEVPCSDA